MKRVLKYEIPVGDVVTITTYEAEFSMDTVHVDVDQMGAPDKVLMWLETEGEYDEVDRHFQVFGTGQSIPDDAEHCGSVRHISTGLVWHLYEVPV